MSLTMEQQALLQQFLGKPKVTFERFGIYWCNQRQPELDAMVEVGALKRRESVETWGPTVAYIVTAQARLQMARMTLNAEGMTP